MELDDLAWMLARVPAPFTVEAPDGLRERFAVLAARLSRAAVDPGLAPPLANES